MPPTICSRAQTLPALLPLLLMLLTAAGCHSPKPPRCPPAPRVKQAPPPPPGTVRLNLRTERYDLRGGLGGLSRLMDRGLLSSQGELTLPGGRLDQASGAARFSCEGCVLRAGRMLAGATPLLRGLPLPVPLHSFTGELELRRGDARVKLLATAVDQGGPQLALSARLQLRDPLARSPLSGEARLTLGDKGWMQPGFQVLSALLQHLRQPDGSYLLKMTGTLGHTLARMDRPAPRPRPPRPAPAEAAPAKDLVVGLVTPTGKGSFRLDRRRLDRALQDLAALARQARIVPSFRDGKPLGFKIFAIRPGSLFAALGLRNGDTVTAVNGQPITTPDKALMIYTRLRTAKRFSVDLLRRNRPVTLHYEVK